jgi:hypothetical protein
VWLGLSQLHTLHDVDLKLVSLQTIAAALPKLHTLTAFCGAPSDDAPGAAFFGVLLPRLRVFHFRGSWPGAHLRRQQQAEHDLHLPVVPLPLLEELVWSACSNHSAVALRYFSQSQPTVLHVPFRFIERCLAERGGGGDCCGPLSRVREIHVRGASLAAFGPSSIARLLRAAPQLRRFHAFGSFGGSASRLAPAFEGLIHPLLRELRVSFADPDATARLDANFGLRLRRLHFPRLRELTVGWREFLVTPADDNAGHPP